MNTEPFKYVDPAARSIVAKEIAKFNHEPGEFEIWPTLTGNVCALCNALDCDAILRANQCVYSIAPFGKLKDVSPGGMCCVVHGMIAWLEEGKVYQSTNGEVEEVKAAG